MQLLQTWWRKQNEKKKTLERDDLNGNHLELLSKQSRPSNESWINLKKNSSIEFWMTFFLFFSRLVQICCSFKESFPQSLCEYKHLWFLLMSINDCFSNTKITQHLRINIIYNRRGKNYNLKESKTKVERF